MIVRRIAFFVAVLFGLAMTQIPAFVEQYRQGLGVAIRELGAVVARFDSDSAQLGLSESAGIDRLRGNSDQLARARGDAIHDDIQRLATLRAMRDQFDSESPVLQLVTFATHYDSRVAQAAYDDFSPALRLSPETAVLGLIGFVFGGGVVHLTGHQMRRRRERAPPVVRETAA